MGTRGRKHNNYWRLRSRWEGGKSSEVVHEGHSNGGPNVGVSKREEGDSS